MDGSLDFEHSEACINHFKIRCEERLGFIPDNKMIKALMKEMFTGKYRLHLQRDNKRLQCTISVLNKECIVVYDTHLASLVTIWVK